MISYKSPYIIEKPKVSKRRGKSEGLTGGLKVKEREREKETED